MCIALIGGVVSGIGAMMGAMGQANAYKMQAEAHKKQAAAERMKGNYEAGRATERGQRLIGKQLVSFAANGLDTSGSAGDVMADSGTEMALDVYSIRHGARVRENSELYQAKIAKFNASNAKASAPFAFLSPVISGSGSIVGSAYG